MTQPLPDIDSLWDYSRPDLTAERFGSTLPQARAAGNVAYLAELLTQIARTHSLRGQFDAAHALLDEAQGLLAEGASRARVRYLLERGRSFNSAGEPDRGRDLFLQAWQHALACGDDLLAVDALHMLAIVAPSPQALEWNLRALEFAQQSEQPGVAERWLGSLYNNIGWTYHDMGEYNKALDVFRRALEWYRERERPRETRIAQWCIARALRSLGRYEEALALQEENLRQIEATGEPDGFDYEEIGECLLALGRKQEAQEHFARAYGLLSADDWLRRQTPERLERLKTLADAGE
jgi:tetratricopeptide (TPR) repeat protein